MNLCRPCREAARPNPHCSCRRSIDIECPCGETWWVTGDTIPRRLAALEAWSGCDHRFATKAAS